MIVSSIFLVLLGISVSGIAILGFIVFFSDKNSVTNRNFLFFSLVTAVWGIINYLTYTVQDDHVVLVLVRLLLIFAISQAYLFFRLTYAFPEKSFIFNKKLDISTKIVVSVVALLALTKFVFSEILWNLDHSSFDIKTNFGIYFFALSAVSFVVMGIYSLLSKINKLSSDQKKEKSQYILVLLGAGLMFLLIIVFNLIFPVFFNNTNLIPFGAFFTFPFILLTSYSIYRYKLFNTKLAYIGFISFMLTMFSFFNIIYAQDAGQVLLNIIFFVLILTGSIILIKTILREVEQKEKLQQLNDDLKELVVQRENLVHLISHKVKGSFTHSKYIFSEILEGTFGSFSEKIGEIVKKGLDSDKEGIKTIDMVLNSFNLQQGKIKFDFQALDLAKITQEVIDSKNLSAQSKNISLVFEKEEGDFYVMGDAIWLKEVIGNLISNAIIYTQEGEVHVFLKRVSRKIILSVKDSGIGISKEDRSRLFTEGGRGKDSIKYNTDSTGYGLYTVKLVITAHKGFVWAESAGEGQGSKFYIELPSL